MPCKGGYRDRIEASRAQRVKDQEYRESPVYRHWRWLVEEVYRASNGFDNLSSDNQAYFAVAILSHDVYRGGFQSYFGNSASNHYPRALSALMELSATNALRLTVAAKETLFGPEALPLSLVARRSVVAAASAQAEAKLTQIDNLFWKDPDALEERLDKFAAAKGLRARF